MLKLGIDLFYSHSIVASVTIHSWSVVAGEGRGVQGVINSKNALNLVKRHNRKICGRGCFQYGVIPSVFTQCNNRILKAG
jgi:hypothetical protein